MSEDTPGRTPDDLPERMSKAPLRVSEDTDRLPQGISKDMAHRMSQRMVEHVPGRKPESMSDGMPQGMSV